MKAKIPTLFGLLCFALLGAFIWLQNTAWMVAFNDTLPILLAFPAFYWAGAPWYFRSEPAAISKYPLIIGLTLFVVGMLTSLTIILALAWTILFCAFFASRLEERSLDSLWKLSPLLFFGFPWIALDAEQIGWWFRLSGAHVTATVFKILNYDVLQLGTILSINQTIISVEAACAGLNTLQAMLIAGTLVNFFILGSTTKYWWNLALIIPIAWFANTLRIIAIAGAALTFGPEFAMGSFHLWGGWFVLIVMFICCWGVFELQAPKGESK